MKHNKFKRYKFFCVWQLVFTSLWLCSPNFIFSDTQRLTYEKAAAFSKDPEYFPNNTYIFPHYPLDYLPQGFEALRDSMSNFVDHYKTLLRYNLDGLTPGYRKSVAGTYNHKGRIYSVNFIKYAKDFPTLTNQTLHFYLSGKYNFFTVLGKQGQEVYTADGRFSRLKDGRLVTTVHQFPVLGEEGQIYLPDENVSVNSRGEIYHENNYVDKFKVSSFVDANGLWSYNNTHFYRLYPKLVREKSNASYSIRQGFLEGSNIFPGLRTASQFIDLHVGVSKAAKFYFQSYSPMFKAVSPD